MKSRAETATKPMTNNYQAHFTRALCPIHRGAACRRPSGRCAVPSVQGGRALRRRGIQRISAVQAAGGRRAAGEGPRAADVQRRPPGAGLQMRFFIFTCIEYT